jgi:hypothetical protein
MFVSRHVGGCETAGLMDRLELYRYIEKRKVGVAAGVVALTGLEPVFRP